MQRGKHAEKVADGVKGFLRKHPGIQKALELFDLSYAQDRRATQQFHTYNGISTAVPEGGEYTGVTTTPK
jgi:hypothetical protein